MVSCIFSCAETLATINAGTHGALFAPPGHAADGQCSPMQQTQMGICFPSERRLPPGFSSEHGRDCTQ